MKYPSVATSPSPSKSARRLLSVLLAGAMALSMYGQPKETAARTFEGTRVTGVVKDAETGAPLEVANIFAMRGKKLAYSAFSDGNGRFNLLLPEEGRYVLRVAFIGYQEAKDTVEASVLRPVWDMGEVLLARGDTLSAASVSAKPILRRELDRLVYDVQADPDARKMDMMAFMAKIPGLEMSASGGRLSYEGEVVTDIRIDDRKNPLINTSRQYPMHFIKAAFMKKIELVMPGSVLLENDTPVLLITLNEPLPVGAAAQLTARADVQGNYGAGVDAVANLPVLGAGVSYTFGYSGPPELVTQTTRTDLALGQETGSRSERGSKTFRHAVGLDFFPKDESRPLF